VERVTPGVRLRPLDRTDAETIARWADDPEFCREADWSVDPTFAQRLRELETSIACPARELTRLAAVHEDLLIGYVDLHGTEADRRELGFVIGQRSRWGRGLGRSAAAAGLTHGFDRLGLRVIWAEAFDSNRRSIRILQGLGMIETSRGEEAMFLGQPTYFRRFEITAHAWYVTHDDA
jgi:RimJ/RimL family protein N-acetyltransferase